VPAPNITPVDWPTAAVSVAASAATATVAIWAIRVQGQNADKDRQHDFEVRRQERRAAAYLELQTALRRLEMGMERTAPIFTQGTPPEVPPPISDEESWRLSALGDVAASDAVRELTETWTRKQSELYNEVWLLQRVQQDESRPSDVKATYGVTSSEQWRKVVAVRQQLRDDLGAIATQVRAEL
jgi:hypothetical protein